MDEEIVDCLNYELMPCENQEFFDAYVQSHRKKFGSDFDPDKAKEYFLKFLEKNKNYTQIKKEDSDLLDKILYEEIDRSLYDDFLKREIKWKIN